MLLFQVCRPVISFEEEWAMSVMAALSFVLVAGFVATGLVGFLGWCQRMREEARFAAHRIPTPSRRARRLLASERRSGTASEGARL